MVSEETTKVEDKLLRDYELVFVISPEVKNEDIDTIIEKVSQFIAERGGTVSEMERWGRRKLAYPIKHFMEGDYVLSRFKAKPTEVKELETSLQISEDILRHLVIEIE